MRRTLITTAVCAVLGTPAAAVGAERDPGARWLPNDPSASWVYAWTDNGYSNVQTFERYFVAERTDKAVRLGWTTEDAGNPPGTPLSAGTIDYLYSDAGLVNTNWSSTPPPPSFPVLCSRAVNCGNSVAGAHYQVIWGTRSPVLQEPLVQGSTWASTGGQDSDVASANRYLGTETVEVPAFPAGVLAAKVESDITQAGALGDPYGSGLKTTWWVYGVGPVKVTFRHAGGELSQVVLHSTNTRQGLPPSDRALLPFRLGARSRFRFTNSKHLKKPSVQELTVGQAATNTARVDVRERSGPIVVRGPYGFTTRLNGVTNLTIGTRSVSRVKFPKLGPRSAPASRRRRLITPVDFMTFGFNPVIPAYPKKGDTWSAQANGRDKRFYDVVGSSRVVGTSKVRVPAGKYQAVEVRSTLKQRGFPYGSGTRRMWFAPGVGLVKLEFRHGDGSVSRIVRLP